MSADPLMLANLEKVAGNELKQLRSKCLVLMQQDGDAAKFPGAQPVSFERKHLQQPEGPRTPTLMDPRAPYFAAEKTDGVRYMLLILGDKGTFTVDRNFDMRRLPPMRFPLRADATKSLTDTLLDGELVLDNKKRARGDDADVAATEAQMRFLAYDACRVAGVACCEEPLRMRLMRLRRDVLGPRYALCQADPDAFSGELFRIDQKDFFALKHLPHIFSQVDAAPPGSSILYAYNDPLRELSHGNDGIIFTPARDPYRPGTCPSLLKWKPANMNSIDFRLQTKWRKGEPRFVLCVGEQTMLREYAWITFPEAEYARFKADPRADSRIIECVYDPNWHTVEYDPNDNREPTWDHPRMVQGGWRFERIREDKNLPNDISTVKSVEISVRDGISAPELLQALRIPAAPGSLGAFGTGTALQGAAPPGAPPGPPPAMPAVPSTETTSAT